MQADTAASRHLASCHLCLKLADASLHECPRCGEALHLRKSGSLQRTLALLVTASILYIPANVLAVTITDAVGKSQADTIMSGVMYFLHHGDWPLALVILRPEFKGKVNPEDIRSHLGRTFAKWQLPDEVLFVEALPKTSVGKMDKKVLRAEYKDLYLV